MKDSVEGYKVGERIRMVYCADPYAPIESGTEGVIEYIDDAGVLHMKWENGRTLGVVLGEDIVEMVR